MNHSHACPCLSGLTYQYCCQPLHQHQAKAGSAEALMRSRYSAFYLGEVDYLINTLHPNQRQENERQLLANNIADTKWIGLKIIKHQQQINTAKVEFAAFYEADPVGHLHERSNFIKINDEWFYVDGDILPPTKLARNEPCFCGSGKKFKRCHG